VQQRVATDQAAVATGGAAAADLPLAQAVLADITSVNTTEQSQDAGATTRLNAAKSASTAAAATITALTTAIQGAPLSLTNQQAQKLDAIVTTANYATAFSDVVTALRTLATDSVTAAEAKIDLAASRQKVMARAKALSDWVAVAEWAIGQAGPLVTQATAAVSAGDLAGAWWAIGQANTLLSVVDDATTSSDVTTAITDLGTTADAYATDLSASLAADQTVAADMTTLAAKRQALAVNVSAIQASLVALVRAGL
jgi:hypothetical protein